MSKVISQLVRKLRRRLGGGVAGAKARKGIPIIRRERLLLIVGSKLPLLEVEVAMATHTLQYMFSKSVAPV